MPIGVPIVGKFTVTSNTSYLMRGWSESSIFNFGRVEKVVPVITSEPVDHHFPNLLLGSSIFTDEKYLSFLVCGSHHFIVFFWCWCNQWNILLVSYYITLKAMRWWFIYHIKRLCVHEFWDYCHNIQSDVRHFLMHYGAWIYFLNFWWCFPEKHHFFVSITV